MLTGANDDLTGRILAFDTANWRTSRHDIARWPQCPACGGRPHTKQRKWPKQPLDRLISPVSGLINRVDVKEIGDHFFLAEGELTLIVHKDRSGPVSLNRRMPVAGKGSTEASARESCIGEAVERYSLLYHGDEPCTVGAEADLGARCLKLNDLLCFSEQQRRTRGIRNRRDGGFHSIPEQLPPGRPIEWMTARSLMNSRRTLVPAPYCLLGYGASYCTADTNGCAAGSNPGMATLNGLLELIERDSVAIWWYSRVRRPRLCASNLEASFRNAFPRRELALIDLTSDLRVPVVAAVSSNKNGRMIVVGAAAHPDVYEAARKAVAEAAQLSATVPERPGRPNAAHSDEERAVLKWWRSATLENQAYLRPSRECRIVNPAAESPRPAEALLEHCLLKLEKARLEAYYVDQTRPEVGIPVRRVIVPGLRHNWARFGPGRLYDVPLALGWLRRRTPEQDLNPLLFPW
jgi:ribosomal protein S12 methylthiotransferase accessory factor